MWIVDCGRGADHLELPFIHIQKRGRRKVKVKKRREVSKEKEGKGTGKGRTGNLEILNYFCIVGLLGFVK